MGGLLPGITVAIPTIPPRKALLRRAIGAALGQTLPPAGIAVALDSTHAGSWDTRDRALRMVTTEWVAFCDDDDVFMPRHLEALYETAVETGADYIYSYYVIQDKDGNEHPDYVLGHFGKVFDPDDPIQTTITTLVRTELAQQVGFISPPEQELVHGERLGEDFVFTLGCIKAGAKIVHRPERTWWWVHHGYGTPGVAGNTSGQPDRW